MTMQKLKNIPIEQVSQYLGLTVLKKHKIRCPQPIHKNGDKTPSLQLYPDTNSWFCFTCRVGGSVIDLVMFIRQCSLSESIQVLEGMLQ